MKKYLHFDIIAGYFFVIAIVILFQSFTLKAASGLNNNSIKSISKSTEITKQKSNFNLVTLPIKAANDNQEFTNLSIPDDSIGFEIKVIKPRKFLLSFYKRQASDIFIKIYDVLGNLIHQEKVSKKGKFKKEYDLSGYKNELYVIEVGDSTSTHTKRLFVG